MTKGTDLGMFSFSTFAATRSKMVTLAIPDSCCDSIVSRALRQRWMDMPSCAVGSASLFPGPNINHDPFQVLRAVM